MSGSDVVKAEDEDLQDWELVDTAPLYDDDTLNEPIDGSYPPDGEDLLDKMDARAGRTPRRSPKRLIAIERQRRGVELRKAGLTWEQIADTLGYSSASSAYRAVKTALDRTLAEPAGDLRMMQYERLNTLLVKEWTDHNKNGGNLDNVLKLMDRIEKLMGVNVLPAQRHEVTGNVDVDVDVSGAIIVAEVDPKKYLQAMQRMVAMTEEQRTRLEQQQPALPVGSDDDIIDGDIIDVESSESIMEVEDGSTGEVPGDVANVRSTERIIANAFAAADEVERPPTGSKERIAIKVR